MDDTKFYAVIVAGGSGLRMQTNTPKQFLLLNGLPIIMHTILKFSNNKYKPKIILVLAEEHLPIWDILVKDFCFKPNVTLVCGGHQRFFSVKNSLQFIEDNAIIAIHDAVRPMLSDTLISKSFEKAVEQNNAVCALQSKDSVRQLSNNGQSIALPRNQIYLIQTPQVFNSNQLKKAYSVNYQASFTDDASVVENAGYAINLIEGETDNFKITHPIDLKIAQSMLLD